MPLGFGLDFSDFNSLKGLKKIDRIFWKYCSEQVEHDESIRLISRCSNIAGKEYSLFLIKIAPLFNNFLADLFNINEEVSALSSKAAQFNIIYQCKRHFVQRFALKKYPPDRLGEIDIRSCSNQLTYLLGSNITEQVFAARTLFWQSDTSQYAYELEIAAQYAAFMVYNDNDLTLFKVPFKLNPGQLIDPIRVKRYQQDYRIGFDYYAPEFNWNNALDQTHYCIYCHNQDKDSCSKGLYSKDKNLAGCPLQQKISEMNYVNSLGFVLAALGIIMIDNPLAAATGYRICNDCISACIYQKQQAVDVPLTESQILDTVLELPYGVEIYLLLTRWNPLNIHAPLPQAPTGYNVLVAGLGPAGFSIAYYLLRAGHNVTAVEGLKVTPLSFNPYTPIKFWGDYKAQLSARMPQGFGGVAEYGITTRWDKNKLTLIRLILERHHNFKYYSSVRLGSNITDKQAFELGFDHIAICSGGSNPKFLDLPGFFAKGVRTATDFLMTLQSGGAFLKDSSTNLTIRMPVVVIGGGLTAIDAAVEVLNYYPVQVEKFLANYENLVKTLGKELVESQWNQEEKTIAAELISHARKLREQKNKKDIRKILEELGGVIICYRGKLADSPAYKLNVEEIIYAQAEGVKFVENMTPKGLTSDEYGYVDSIKFDGSSLKAKTVLVAIGNSKQFIEQLPSNSEKYSYLGDANPIFAGSVVKAIASSKNSYKAITDKLSNYKPKFIDSHAELTSKLDQMMLSEVKQVNILSDNIVELIIKSPLAAANFKPGQFFRLQNYASDPLKLMEPLALTGAAVDIMQGLIHFIILENGRSSKLCRYLQPGEIAALMGPTGMPTMITSKKNVALIGGGLGLAALFSIGKALKENGCHVICIAGYKKAQDRFHHEKIQDFAEMVVWCCEERSLQLYRKDDVSLQGNILDGLRFLASSSQKLSAIEHVFCIGSNKMMQAVFRQKKTFFPNTPFICSLNSPMQCMMQGICGQCVQKVADERGYIFSCASHEQEASIIDFNALEMRLQQNSLQEKIDNMS